MLEYSVNCGVSSIQVHDLRKLRLSRRGTEPEENSALLLQVDLFEICWSWKVFQRETF